VRAGTGSTSPDDYEAAGAVIDSVIVAVEQFPTSSYSDYARFALARAHVKGIGAALKPSVGTLIVRDDHRASAAALLDDVRSEDFAFRPNVLVLRLKLLDPEANGKRIKSIEDELNRRFPDALEWRAERARRELDGPAVP
jgi:hypothetical protein